MSLCSCNCVFPRHEQLTFHVLFSCSGSNGCVLSRIASISSLSECLSRHLVCEVMLVISTGKFGTGRTIFKAFLRLCGRMSFEGHSCISSATIPPVLMECIQQEFERLKKSERGPKRSNWKIEVCGDVSIHIFGPVFRPERIKMILTQSISWTSQTG